MKTMLTSKPACKSLVAMAGLATALLVGCASGPEKAPELKPPPVFDKVVWEAMAIQRANERWRLIQQKNYAEAFAYYTAASRKDVTPANLETNIRNMRASAGNAVAADCNPEKCTVSVDTTVSIRIPRVGNKQQTVPFPEVWVPENGSLYLIRPQ
jgi:hypothetical protein